METNSIAVTIITFNEEQNIRRCLESVRWADEIIVVDSFSSDATVAICREYTDRIIQRQWPGFREQKQFALEQAGCDWVLNLDADEQLSPNAIEQIQQEILRGNPAADGFIFPRQSYYLGRWIRHGGWYPDLKLRLVRRGHGRWVGANLHEKLEADGATTQLTGKILHYVYRDITHQLQTVASFSQAAAEEWHRNGKKFNLLEMLLRPPLRFLAMYFWKGGMRDGLPGFIIAVITSYYVFLKYARLWELQRDRAQDGSG